MGSCSLPSKLFMQAAKMQSFSAVSAKRPSILSPADAALYGKRFAASTYNDKEQDDISLMEQDRASPTSQFCDNTDIHKTEANETSLEALGYQLPPEPTNCCMSGCANCVWIQYAEELKNKFCTDDKEAREIILNKISDPNMKMFIAVELNHEEAENKYRPQ